MKKVYVLEDLDCAACAAKMSEKINKLDGVVSAEVSFLTQKLTIEAEDKDFDKIIAEAKKVIKKIEPDCNLIV